MPRALLLSPHVGDIAFSCGATARHLLRGGWDVQLITIFDAEETNLDRAFCEIIGLENYEHWDLPPGQDVLPKLQPLETPATVFAPQGLSNHVDDLQVIRAVRARGWDKQAFWYREIPAAILQPAAKPSELLPNNLSGGFVTFDEDAMQLKIEGCLVYRARVEAQFGGPDGVAAQLAEFHRAEARAVEREPFAERFVVGV